MKVDSNGEKIWEQNFGGDLSDKVLDLELTSDGGILVGGESGSGQYGNKSSLSYGSADYWIVRLDADGNKLWDRSYGGASADLLRDIQSTADGGFLLLGDSHSEATGSKTTPHYGTGDDWIVRLDGHGNQLWDFSLGSIDSELTRGSLHEPSGRIMVAPDGGYLVATHSSGINPSGNKTVAGYGHSDFWVVKLRWIFP